MEYFRIFRVLKIKCTKHNYFTQFIEFLTNKFLFYV